MEYIQDDFIYKMFHIFLLCVYVVSDYVEAFASNFYDYS